MSYHWNDSGELTPCVMLVYRLQCHSIFDRNWTSETTIGMVLNCVYGLLLSPATDDPLDSRLALSFYEADGAYEARIMEATAKFAATTRTEWAKRLLIDPFALGHVTPAQMVFTPGVRKAVKAKHIGQ